MTDALRESVLKAALEKIIATDQQEKWFTIGCQPIDKATVADLVDGPCAEIARAALAPAVDTERQAVGWLVTWPDGATSFYRGSEKPGYVKGNTYQPLFTSPAPQPAAMAVGQESAQ